MARLRTPDGAEIHLEERGSGPLVVIVPHASGIPEVYDPLAAELERDHRLLRYDARGTGGSSRQGPHDMETCAHDLETVIAAAGGGAVAVAMLDGCNHAIRVAARRPELLVAVVAVAALPVARSQVVETDSLISSDAVMETLLQQYEADYRGAMRTIAADGNPQMSEDEIRARVRRQLEYCPRETGVPMIRAFVEDDVSAPARELGDRLHLLYSPELSGAWFPSLAELEKLVAQAVPDASMDVIEGGVISNPGPVAAIVRRARAAASAGVG